MTNKQTKKAIWVSPELHITLKRMCVDRINDDGDPLTMDELILLLASNTLK